MPGEIKQRVKRLIEEKIYRFLMRNAKYHWGRKLFNHEELRLLNEALVTQNLFGVDGKMVPAFEKEFAQTYGVPYAVASTSGTAALHTALGALDLNPGDEVITAPITDLGTIIPILYQQCIPVFADINHTYNMDPQDVERKINPRTKAILVVHLFGNPCNMDAMAAIAKRHNIPLIEDCAQAHVTEYKGRYVGTIGDIGCFSFQQAKHMTTGDGGMTITSNKAYYEKMKLFVDKGYARKGWGSRAYLFLGLNYRMNELTAAVGLAQLKKVKGVVQKRNELGNHLTQLIRGIDGLLPAPVTEGSSSSYWVYPLYLESLNGEAFAKEMIQNKVWAGAGYTGKPIYLCSESLTGKKTFGNSQFPFSPRVTDKVYEYKEGLCPKAEETLKHLVCIYPDETWDKARIEKTAQIIKNCFAKLSGQTIAPATVMPTVKDFSSAPAADSATPKTRIGIIGCGQMGRWHLDSYKLNPNVQVVACVDTDLVRATDFAKRVNGKVYGSHQEMIKNEKLDGVSVCTVPSTHRDIVLDLLDAGIHVLCEKPMAVSVSEAQAMLAKAQERKRLLLAAHKFRFFDEVSQAKHLLEKNSLGRIINFRLMFGGYMDMANTWYVKKDVSGGGILMDNGPHAFDLIHYLLGDFESVSAKVKNFQSLEVEDTAQISCILKSGAQGLIDISWSTAVPAKTYLEIYGEEGAALLDFQGLTYRFKTWDDWKRVPNQLSIKEAFNCQIDHFVAALQGTPPSIIKNEDGLAVQKLIQMAYETLGKV